MKSENQINLWIKLALMLIAVIFLTSTTISCSTTPTTPRLPVPEKPDFPKLTDDELKQLAECKKGKTLCTVSRSVLLKFQDKVIMYRGYAREAIAVIEKNNQVAGGRPP